MIRFLLLFFFFSLDSSHCILTYHPLHFFIQNGPHCGNHSSCGKDLCICCLTLSGKVSKVPRLLPAWHRWRATPPLLTAGSLILISIRTAFCFEGSLLCSQVSKGNKLMAILTTTASFSYIMWSTGHVQVHPQIL